MRSLVPFFGPFFVMVPAAALAADYYVCERTDGTVLLTDREAAVPQDCSERRTVALPNAPAAHEPIDPERTKIIDAVIEEGRRRREAAAISRDAFEAAASALRRELIDLRLKLADARVHSNWMSWRWSAFFPGDWIPWFVDPEHQQAVARQIELLEREEARALAEIRALRANALDAGVSREIVGRALPRDLDDGAL